MKKLVFIILIFLYAGLSAGFGEARDIEDYYLVMESSKTPAMSRQYPTENMNALLITAGDEMIQFFASKGIDAQYLNGEATTIPDDVFLQMSSLCNDCKSEFCTALKSSVAHLMGTHYDAIVVRIADVYWTVLT